MLRYQNKYRSVIKNRPEYVEKLVADLNAQGVECDAPQVNHRPRADMRAALDGLEHQAKKQTDPELVKAVETLTRFLSGQNASAPGEAIQSCTDAIVDHVRGFVVLPTQERIGGMDEFCAVLLSRVDALEAALTAT